MLRRRSVFPFLFGLWVTGCAASLQDAKLTQLAYDGETNNFNAPPTDAIRRGAYEGATPLRIRGATTITTPQLRDMMLSSTPPVVINVLDGQRTLSLPGAIWLPAAGLGTGLSDDTQARLKKALATLSGGDPARNLVFLCLSKTCWLSHNATVRAVALGYTSVYWYRGGLQAWLAAGLPMTPVSRGAW